MYSERREEIYKKEGKWDDYKLSKEK